MPDPRSQVVRASDPLNVRLAAFHELRAGLGYDHGILLEPFVREALRLVARVEVLSSGWPDFAVFSGDRLVACVEVKSRRDRARPDQERIHQALRFAGVDVRVVRPEDVVPLVHELRDRFGVHS